MTQAPEWIAAARLLRRTGFGARGPQVDVAARQDPAVYVDAALSVDPEADAGAIATPMPTLPMPTFPSADATSAQNDAFIAELLVQMGTLGSWWVRRMAAVQQPLGEKLTLLWHNHFAVSASKVRVAELMAAQNRKLRTLALGDFHTMAFAMLTDPAMLHWLDGIKNTRAAPNENLSREFMELFTLGHGSGYTEADVREGARALTGRLVGPGGQTAVSAADHDAESKTVLGVTGNLDEGAFCDAVLGQTASAPFVATKLWLLLASDDRPSEATLNRLVTAYGPDRNLRALTRAVLLDPDFAARSGTLVSTPVEWAMGVVRSLAVPLDDPQTMAELDAVLAAMGQRPFYPPDVNGWPRGTAWLSTTNTAARVWAANRFVELGDLETVDATGRSDRIDAAGYLIGVGAWSDSTVAALKPLTADPRRLVAAAVNAPEYLTA